jgi:glycerol-3-phosphate dehydrogenase
MSGTPLSALEGSALDVIVLGGSLAGAACALELAQRGYRVALVEPHDLGGDEPGGAAPLLEEGFRALARGRLRRARAVLRERLALVHAAPHLATPAPFVVAPAEPAPSSRRLVLRAAVQLSEWLAHPRRGWPPARWLDPEQVQVLLPGLETGPAAGPRLACYDAVVDARRLAVCTGLAARSAGAVVATRCELVSLGRDGRARLRDDIDGTSLDIEVRAAVDASGPARNGLRGRLGLAKPPPRRASARGLHLVLAHRVEAGLVLADPHDGRLVRVLPTATGLLASTNGAGAAAAERLAALLAQLFPRAEEAPRVAFTRPIAPAPRHRLRTERAGAVPVVTLPPAGPGGHRPLARTTADHLVRALGPARTPGRPAGLPGAELVTVPGLEAAARARGLSGLQARWLVRRYGALWEEVLRTDSGALGRTGLPLAAEIDWGVKAEGIRTLADLLLRWRLPEIAEDRDDEQAIVAAAAARLEQLAGWSAARRERELLRWRRERERAWEEIEP